METEPMGYAPALALERFSSAPEPLAGVDVIDMNEAFASQALGVIRDLGLDPAQVNPSSGVIALRHPVGATGAIVSVRVAKDLARRRLE